MRTARIPVRDTWPLRRSVLRPGMPPEACALPLDDDPATFHLGAWAGEELLGIATFHPAPCPGGPQAAAPYRLRGMAVHPGHRGEGLGASLVREGLHQVKAAGGDLVWCHARLPARGFYRALGFAEQGETFEVDGIGTHQLMHRRP